VLIIITTIINTTIVVVAAAVVVVVIAVMPLAYLITTGSNHWPKHLELQLRLRRLVVTS
jgi:hypothetical protein